MPTVYYIRHGQTEWNALGRLQGVQDIPLNEIGREQAAHAGEVLTGLLKSDGHSASSIDFVSSPLGRTRQTMDLVRTALGISLTGYATDDRLREIGYGRWEGSTLAQMQAKYPDLFARRQADKWTVAPPEGETYVSVQARMTEWYEDLKADTVAVAHGGTARALMVALGCLPPDKAADLSIEQGGVYVFKDRQLSGYYS